MTRPMLALVALAMIVGVAALVRADEMTSTQTRIAGDALVREGKFKQAGDLYTKAIALDPNDKMNYFKRAVVRQGMGVLKLAVADLTKAIELDAAFARALERRAELQKLLGMFSDSQASLAALLALEPSNAKAASEQAAVAACAAAAATAERAAAGGDWDTAIASYGTAAECATRDSSLRAKRAETLEKKGDFEGAALDAARASKLAPADLALMSLLARVHYANGALEDAANALGDCLRSDETYAPCKSEYKSVRKLKQAWAKGNELLNSGAPRDALAKLDEALAVAGSHRRFGPTLHGLVCSAHLKLKAPAAAIAACNRALELDELYLDALLRLGEAHTMAEQYDEAVRAYARARQHHPNSHDAQRGHDTAQRVLKAASRKDLYKILDVPRTASTADINKAYRKLAREWHPDKWEGVEEKAAAEKRFHDLALAKEVLTDEDKRRRFDAGEDVEMPQQQQQQHNPFGFGGGQQFHFRFG